MNEITKTIAFVVMGAVLVASAVGVNHWTQPQEFDQFALVGEEFFPEFDSANDAKSLEIVAFNFEKREPDVFRVEYKDKLWRIPSHHNYPAEAADRLAKTAASILGIRREAISGRRESEHERFGVIDPQGEKAAKIGKGEKDSVGIRVTVSDKSGEVLADYIVGKEVEQDDLDEEFLREIRGEDAAKPRHYIRRPDEKETYIATVEIDASTKFSDWIEPDLLLLESNDLRQLVINSYSLKTEIEEVEILPGVVQQVSRSKKVDGETNTLTKDSNFGSWKLAGLKEDTEELETSKITDITGVLDNFKIQGVRPRLKIDGQAILKPDLTIDFPKSIRSQQAAQEAVQETAEDLDEKGFHLTQDPDDGTFRIVSTDGELSAATSEGAVYRLYFGKVFSGGDTEIEIGGQEKQDESKTEKDDAEKPDPENKGEGNESSKEDESDKKKSRYLLVRVEFDPKFVDDKPTPPTEPTKPEEPTAEEKSRQPAMAQKPGDDPENPPKGPVEKAYQDALSEYEAAKNQYQTDKKKYEDDLKAYEKKLAEGQMKVETLNERFADWYYVVSVEEQDSIRLSRADLVRKKEPPKENGGSKPPLGLPSGLPSGLQGM